MVRYLIRRILLFIPTLFVISAATFFLSKTAPSDDVSSEFRSGFSEQEYIKEAIRQGLDKPNFYFTLTTQAYPDTFHRILFIDRKETLENLIGEYGNWRQINSYFQSIYSFQQDVESSLPEGEIRNKILVLTDELFTSKDSRKIAETQSKISAIINSDSVSAAFLKKSLSVNTDAFTKMVKTAEPTNHLIPKFIWFGKNNQYHDWITKFMIGDFGYSSSGESVSQSVKNSVYWTLILNSVAIILAFGIAIPLGVKAATEEGSRFDKNLNFLLYAFYSMPVFWVGTMLLVFFCTPDYGMKLFPSGGLGGITGTHSSYISMAADRFYHLVLPVFCITYPSIAYIFRQMRGSMISELKKNYIRTARAKGLPEKKVIWKHTFPNALFPIITLVANILPALITGSVAIEVVFSLPGMGRLMIESIQSNDWDIVYAVMMFGAILTMLGVLLSDVLYAWLDPRIRY